ncbi:MAG: choice-of-anchor J domain-containing protein [Bacteroidetes bacterium]|nr:choice-of-anchor J domain-containing protein [Bacteroidota bacterium]
MERRFILFNLFFLFLSTYVAAQQQRSLPSETRNIAKYEKTGNNAGASTSIKTIYSMDFESVTDFSLNFSPWITFDKDTSATYQVNGVTFPHSGSPFAFIAFNPAQTTPPMTDLNIQPHSGSRFGGCFDDETSPNNDWFISPHIHLETGGSFSFWVKSYTANYGLEKYEVAISVTDSNPSSFTIISGATPLAADTFWTKKNFSLSAYNNQNVYVAIQCVSEAAFLFMIDDIEVTTTPSAPSSAWLDFESISDFSLTFYPWMTIDVNGGATYNITNYSFPNTGDPFAFIAFNPATVSPPITDNGILPHSGNKYGACFSSAPPSNPNNKWLISPLLHLTSNPHIEFWTKTYNPDYGYEKYNVAVSTTSLNPNTFVSVSGPVPLEAPENWGYRRYELNGYANMDVYVGIQCVTDNGFIFMIDDIFIGENLGIQDSFPEDGVTVFPNPARDRIFINFGNRLMRHSGIVLYNTLGEAVCNPAIVSKLAGSYELKLPRQNGGVYFLSLPFEERTVNKKIIFDGD